MFVNTAGKALLWTVKQLVKDATPETKAEIRASIEQTLQSDPMLELWLEADQATRLELKKTLESAFGEPVNLDNLDVLARQRRLARQLR